MDHRYRKFYEVAKHGSFSAAALSLGKSQPAITLAISSLERTLGVKLFERHRYDVTLTEAGKVVFASAKRMLKEDSLLSVKLAALNKDRPRQVGIIDSLAYLIYSRSKEFELLGELKIMVDNSKTIISDLYADKVDLGLITGQPGYLNKEIRIKKLHSEKFVFVRSAKTINKHRSENIEDWLAFNSDSTTYAHFTKQFKKLGLMVRPIFHSTSLELLKDMAIAGRGTALLPYHMVKEDIKDKKLKEIKTASLARPIWAIVKRKNKLPLDDDISRQLNQLLSAASPRLS